MLRRTLPSPDAPSVRGEFEGRPYWLWLPKSKGPWPGMVILHGAGSRKENHGDFARMCASGGWAAISYDQRGHGESADEMSPAALGDVAKMARFLASHESVDADRIFVRGSSMGGFWAIHAAATSEAIAGAIAICPAGEEHLRRMLGGKKLDFRVSEASRDALSAWLGEHDLREAAELMGAKPLMILHARGDERIPSDFSEEVAARKPEPKRLLILPGGHHRSIQHDQEMQSVALAWLRSKL
ncbi:MAG: alpha/beta fold hydrolase [Actinomycetota bacterium]|nr:alpha/beta fold hydrolase [Actinomycetota bacterium]